MTPGLDPLYYGDWLNGWCLGIYEVSQECLVMFSVYPDFRLEIFGGLGGLNYMFEHLGVWPGVNRGLFAILMFLHLSHIIIKHGCPALFWFVDFGNRQNITWGHFFLLFSQKGVVSMNAAPAVNKNFLSHPFPPIYTSNKIALQI